MQFKQRHQCCRLEENKIASLKTYLDCQFPRNLTTKIFDEYIYFIFPEFLPNVLINHSKPISIFAGLNHGDFKNKTAKNLGRF